MYAAAAIATVVTELKCLEVVIDTIPNRLQVTEVIDTIPKRCMPT